MGYVEERLAEIERLTKTRPGIGVRNIIEAIETARGILEAVEADATNMTLDAEDRARAGSRSLTAINTIRAAERAALDLAQKEASMTKGNAPDFSALKGRR